MICAIRAAVAAALIAGATIAAVLPTPAIAGPYEEIVILHQRGYHAAARHYMRPLAEQGDRRAQYEMGSMLMYGEGGPVDVAAALRWFKAAAERGSVEAQRMLGTLYGSGLGVPQSYQQAAEWYRRAADRGDTSAQTSLGLLYENGLGVPRDPVEACKWFEVVLIRYPDLRENKDDAANISRRRVAARMTADEIREAERRAQDWMAEKH